MSSTTTIRLPEELKARVAQAARQAGTTAHSFILEAIADKTELIERQTGFHAEAEQRLANLTASGKTLAWPEVRHYLEARAAGQAAARPKARKFSK
jgi:predicted transcriptional regulator